MTAVSDSAGARAGIVRDPATWYSYLLLGFFTYMNTSQGNIIPFLQGELQLTFREVSLHSSAIALGMLIVGFIGDRIINRYGRRAMLIFGTMASSVALVLLALAPSVYVTVGSCFLIGLTGAFIPAIVSALLSDLHGSRRDIALTEANALCYVFAIGAPIIVAIAVWAGWSWRVVPLAGVVAGVVILTVFWRTQIRDETKSASVSRAPLPPAYWGYWAMLGFGVALEFAALLWAPLYLEKVVGLDPSAAAIGGSVFFVAMLIGRTAGIRLIGVYPPRTIFFGMTALTFIGFAGYWLGPIPAVVIAGLFVIGLGISLLFPISISFAMAAAGAASDRGSTRAMLAPALAIILTPPLLGSLADNAGLWLAQTMIPVFAVATVIALLVATRLERYSASSS